MAELQLGWSPVQDRGREPAHDPPGGHRPESRDRVLAVTLGVLRAVAEGVPIEDAVCRCLAREVDAVVAACVALDPDAQTASVVAWPRPLDPAGVQTIVDEIRAAVATAGNGPAGDHGARGPAADAGRPGCRGPSPSRRWEQVFGCRDIAHVALDVPGPAHRLVVLGGRTRFSSATAHLLDCLRGPLSDLLRIAGEPDAAALPAARDPVPCLTEREVEVLRLTAQGLLARTIALRLAVSPRTVHKHLGNIYRKLDAHDRLVAVRRAERLGLLGQAPPAAAPDGPGPLPQVVVVRLAAVRAPS